ncbi:MAG TPA: hypothetical protein VGS62_11815 [Streptosporangiaceae bacterium]|nr:hypothetical protein [Streptosporangiaceae bacterium]
MKSYQERLSSGRTLVLAAGETPSVGGTIRICRDLAEAQAAETSGISRRDLLVETAPRQAAALIRAGWQVVLDADATDSPDVAMAPRQAAALVRAGWQVVFDADATDSSDVATAVAAAALGAWLGAAAVRSRHVAAVRRAVDMAESIRGTRPVPRGGRARS